MTHEIDWLTASELAGICGTDAFALREMLETAGLADGPEPSGLAMRHGFAEPSTEEAGRPSVLWHRDVAVILRGLLDDRRDGGDEGRAVPGELGVTPEPREVQTDVFDLARAEAPDPVEALDPQASDAASRTRGRTPAGPARDARGPGGVEPSGVGDVRPGFDAIVATDGACSGNPGPGGWAWVEQITGARDSGGAARTTNNAMELTALVRALEYVGPSGDLLIRADSQYAINTMTKWAPSWRRKGWKKADGKPVANRELVERLLTLYEARIGRTEVEWVRGHAGDAANELADALAVARSREFL